MYELVLMHLVFSLLILGFGYIVLRKAAKDPGKSKIAGQIIGWGLVVVVVLIWITCGLNKQNCPLCPHEVSMKKQCMKGQQMEMMGKQCPKAEVPSTSAQQK